MIISREKLQKYYSTLEGSFEGYIQMSDRKLDKDRVLQAKEKLPRWEEIHTVNNFIHEACLFDGNRSGKGFVTIH